MYRIVRRTVMSMLSMLLFITVLPVYAADIEGETGVSFYYAEDKEDQEKKDQEREDPLDSGNSNKVQNTKKPTLPQTGETGSSAELLFGIIILCVAMWMLVTYKRINLNISYKKEQQGGRIMRTKKLRKAVASAMLFAMLAGVASSSILNAEAAENKTLSSDGSVSFEAGSGGGPGTIDPIDPPTIVDPYPDPNPGTDGPLSIDFVSDFNFGKNEISSDTKVYYAKAQKEKVTGTNTYVYRPNFVQVTDNRGNNHGWSLVVKQEGQLANSDSSTVNKELTGATIAMDNTWVNTMMDVTKDGVVGYNIKLDPNGASSAVLNAYVGKGAGTWFGIFGQQNGLQNTDAYGNTIKDDHGDDTMFNPSVTLTIPGKTPKDAVTYTTTLRWTLQNTPI